jgi:hypothetical protein
MEAKHILTAVHRACAARDQPPTPSLERNSRSRISEARTAQVAISDHLKRAHGKILHKSRPNTIRGILKIKQGRWRFGAPSRKYSTINGGTELAAYGNENIFKDIGETRQC